MPKMITSTAVITISVEVKNNDGSAFTYSRTGTDKWMASTVAERRVALRARVKDQADMFLDHPIETVNQPWEEA